MSKCIANVLIVDDEREIRELLTDALSLDGINAISAASGKEALDLARTRCPDLVVTDLLLGDCTGLDVIERLRRLRGDVSAVVITGQNDPASLTEASRHRPVELMTKPLNLQQFTATIRKELSRQVRRQRKDKRFHRLRTLARAANQQRRDIQHRMETTCADLTNAYRNLNSQMGMQQLVMGYQNELIAAKTDDDVFRSFFRLFVRRSGPVYGVSLVCDAQAKLRIVGRFGVPHPDGLHFCEMLSGPLTDTVLNEPECATFEAQDMAVTFDAAIRKYLIGLSVLLVPLMPSQGEMIGFIVLYRKGEQPFTEEDLALAEMIATPTAAAIRRND